MKAGELRSLIEEFGDDMEIVIANPGPGYTRATASMASLDKLGRDLWVEPEKEGLEYVIIVEQEPAQC